MSGRTFGKFEVLGSLGRGGMAEVHLCRLPGIGGFSKQVVVKRILPERLSDPAFLRMFLDEARLAANLNHPNIVQVFEIDEAEGVPYIAMEYVRGPTLANIIRSAIQARQLHIGHMAKIIAGACAGLHHAHTALGPTGEPLGLVHRDVSPQNILVTLEGVPKILDFGVAKAHGRLSSTEVGTLKGKLRYMAPEQIQHSTVDHRADVFSMGVCLCEATTGQNPFGAPHVTEVELLRKIVSGGYAKPSTLVSRYPEVLDRIITWAIDPDVTRRCPSAQDLADALEAFVSAGTYASSARPLGAWVQSIVPAHLLGVASPEEDLPRTRTSRPQSSGGTSPVKSSGTSWRASLPAAEVGSSNQAGPGVASSRSLKILGAITGVVALAGVAGAAVIIPRLRKPQVVTVIEREKPGNQQFPADDSARAYLDEAERLGKERRFGPALAMLERARELKTSDPALAIRLVRMTDELETSAALGKARSLLAAGSMPQAIEAAKLVLDRAPENQEARQIIASARKTAHPTPVRPPAPAGSKEARQQGTLAVTTTPAGMVYLDDEPIGRAPISKRQLPAGTYTIQVRLQGYRPAERNVHVLPGREVDLQVTLEPERMSMPEKAPVAPAVANVPKPETAPAVTPPKPEGTPTPAATPKPPKPEPTVAAAPPKPEVKPEVKPPPAPTAQPANFAQTPPPPANNDANIISERPKAKIPPPHLPRNVTARDGNDLARLCRLVEEDVISLAGVSRNFAEGVTILLQRTLQKSGNMQIYPVGLYYSIIAEAARGHDRRSAANNLVASYHNAQMMALSKLPAVETPR